MAKTILGIDIGTDCLKMALMNGSTVKKSVVVEMPERLVQSGHIVSVETLGELIRDTMKNEHMRASQAAVILGGDNVFVREVSMPRMTEKQLEYNLPFEFRDYISGELKSYVFDYALLSEPVDEDDEDEDEEVIENGEGLSIMAVAAPAAQLEELRSSLRKAGLKMVKAAPNICAYQSYLRELSEEKEYIVLDLGYTAIRMHVFKGGRHETSRVLETGMSVLDQSIAEAGNVDIHLAHTYLLNDHGGCQSSSECLTAYNGIAVELMRALNFYRFSNPNSVLAGMWLCGGGSQIKPLADAIRSTVDVPVHDGSEWIEDGDSIENCAMLMQAIGITQY